MTQKTQKAILIDLIHPPMRKEDSYDRMQELEALVNTYGGIVIVKRFQKRFAPHPRTFIGPGKVEELAREGRELQASLLIINNQLKPRQTYLVSEAMRPAGVQVWDRIDLILKIFAKHAKTTEARLEIELASIRHMGPRIFGMGMELSRQGGGIGTSGIGETNTERMRRHLKEKERRIKEKLEKFENVREGHRKSRKMNNLKTIALVGYTNAGKTTLLNKMTGRKEFVADQLFATLDTRVGQLFLPRKNHLVLLSDTIGFIKDLPPELINAFASTLSEAVDADFLLQVVDAGDPHAVQQVAVVNEILGKLKIDNKPRLIVFNKIETSSVAQRAELEQLVQDDWPYAWVSAYTDQGLKKLVRIIEDKLDVDA